MISFICPVDNSYELLSNFLGLTMPLLQYDDEMILINDCCDSIVLHDFLCRCTKEDSRIRLIQLSEKSGFGKACNEGVKSARSDTLFFINTDIILAESCIEPITALLWSAEDIAAVQPCILYQQNGRVQSTGHVFSDHRSGHLFMGRKPTDIIIRNDDIRQALTLACCAVKKKFFDDFNGFNSYYYNAYEGMELTLKFTLDGFRCLYCSAGTAYHFSGVARRNILFDNEHQRVEFYQTWEGRFCHDLDRYLEKQLSDEILSSDYIVINFSTAHIWDELLEQMGIQKKIYFLSAGRFRAKVNLFDLLEYQFIYSSYPILFLCDSIFQLFDNKLWFSIRNGNQDIAMDINGNLIHTLEIWQ